MPVIALPPSKGLPVPPPMSKDLPAGNLWMLPPSTHPATPPRAHPPTHPLLRPYRAYPTPPTYPPIYPRPPIHPPTLTHPHTHVPTAIKNYESEGSFLLRGRFLIKLGHENVRFEHSRWKKWPTRAPFVSYGVLASGRLRVDDSDAATSRAWRGKVLLQRERLFLLPLLSSTMGPCPSDILETTPRR